MPKYWGLKVYKLESKTGKKKRRIVLFTVCHPSLACISSKNYTPEEVIP